MNRRRFLAWLGLGSVASVIVPDPEIHVDLPSTTSHDYFLAGQTSGTSNTGVFIVRDSTEWSDRVLRDYYLPAVTDLTGKTPWTMKDDWLWRNM